MPPVENYKYQTGLAAYLLDLLQFMDERIAEARDNPASRPAALTEAAAVTPIIEQRLRRDDQTVLTQFMLVDFFKPDLAALAALPDDDVVRKLNDLGRLVEVARDIVNASIQK